MENRCGRFERGGLQTGLLVGILPSRNRAVDLAVSHAQHRLERCLAVGRRMFDRLAGLCTFAGGAS